VLTLAINNVAQRRKLLWRCCGVLGVRNPSWLPVMFDAFVFKIKRKSLIISLFLTWYCFCSLICHYMQKLDPGMHIDLHLVFFGKTCVTCLDQDLLSYLSWIFALTLLILAFTLSMVLQCLVVLRGGNFAVKGGPNPGPRQLVLLNFEILYIFAKWIKNKF
jgi:hypothetical protein